MDTSRTFASGQTRAATSQAVRPSFRRRRLVTLVLAALAVTGLVSGCASNSSDSSYSYDRGDVAPAEPGDVSEPAPEAKGDAGAPDGQQKTDSVQSRVVKLTTDIYLKVDDLDGATDALEQLVNEDGGYFGARDQKYREHEQSGTFTVRIPADKHDEFLSKLGEFGEVSSTKSTTEDVTLEQVDLESRIESLKSSVKSLRGMLEKAANTTEMLEIEKELSNREAELASLESQLKVLNEDVAYSTVHVHLSTVTVAPESTGGFGQGIAEGWNDFVKSFENFVEGLGYAIPGLILFALILVALWFLGLRKLFARIRQEIQDARGTKAGTTGGTTHRPTTTVPDARPESHEHANAMPVLPPISADDADTASGPNSRGTSS